ncbi:uncharacterized protein PAC_10015 [Phialocephala subalpina]|uniref:PAS domain-containing protein n=1 Tax=Phialocephala subalpina TaxID=576137 RepID=A0A1L7X516_9HELO|nr:uncharacterized protein PAC_10015 [Phialocephala subalpina]
MDFASIKQNLRFRSGRTTNMCKRFPTREPEPAKPILEQQTSKPPPQEVASRKKTKPSPKAASKPVLVDVAPASRAVSQKPKQEVTNEKAAAVTPSSTKVEEERRLSASSSGEADYDLRPTSAKPRYESLETLAGVLFSEEYLRTLTTDPQLLARFSSFLSRYEPSIAPLVLQYIEAQKVIKAVSYANAVAKTLPTDEDSRPPAAELSTSFRELSQHAFNTLLDTALPAWITNQATPLTKDLVGGLSEVFCITDPNQQDNPIIYASEEFYRLTGYGRDNVIGYNCRFLQGSNAKSGSVSRLRKSIRNGKGICETLLNYRRDGRPFVNVLMIAPLHDGKGNLKYYLGAQVDASRLVEGGRGVDGLERCLVKKEMESQRKKEDIQEPKQVTLAKLRDLSMTFDLEESAVVQIQSRRNSVSSRVEEEIPKKGPAARRRLQDDDERAADESDDSGDDNESASPEWTLSQNAKTGKPPGIYKKYLLVRPYPSFRTIFVSESVRKLGKLQQKPLLAYIAAPPSTLSGLRECFQSGTPVTGRVAIMRQASTNRQGTVTGKWNDKDNNPSMHGEICWISATPLFDGKDNVGVWMVVIVDNLSVVSSSGRRMERLEHIQEAVPQSGTTIPKAEDLDVPIKPRPVGIEGSGPVAQEDEDGDEASSTLVPDPKTPDKTQRSASSAQDAVPFEQKREDEANAAPTESQNGSRDHKSDIVLLRHAPSTPPAQEESINGSMATPKRNRITGSGGRGRAGPHDAVGLRAMDYLSAKAVGKKGVNGVDSAQDEEDDGDGKVDWNVASPYSVD